MFGLHRHHALHSPPNRLPRNRIDPINEPTRRLLLNDLLVLHGFPVVGQQVGYVVPLLVDGDEGIIFEGWHWI